jgi:hypothetical protein
MHIRKLSSEFVILLLGFVFSILSVQKHAVLRWFSHCKRRLTSRLQAYQNLWQIKRRVLTELAKLNAIR